MPLYDLLRRMERGNLPLIIRDGCIWGYEEDQAELERAEKDAWSFPGLSPPDQAAYYIGAIRKRRRTPEGLCADVYRFWKDAEGKYWYDTDRGMAFKREMAAIQKKRKKASSRTWMPG